MGCPTKGTGGCKTRFGSKVFPKKQPAEISPGCVQQV